MPDRIVREGWKFSERITRLTAQEEVFFLRLILTVDKNGVFHAEPHLLRAALFPNSPRKREADIRRCRDKCAHAGLISLYTASDGRPYVQVMKFRQKTPRERPRHPLPPGESNQEVGQTQAGLEMDPIPIERSRKERKRGDARDAAPEDNPTPEFSGSYGARTQGSTAEESQDAWIARVEDEFPGGNVRDELCTAIDTQRKKGRTVERRWFERVWLRGESGPTGVSPVVVDPRGNGKVKSLSEPRGWQEWLVKKYPKCNYADGDRCTVSSFSLLPKSIQKEASEDLV